MKDIITSSLSEDFSYLVSDNTEIALDLLLDDGVLKELPVLGNAVSLFKIGKTISDRLFLKNLAHFIYQLKDIPNDKKLEMTKKIDENHKFRMKVGDYLTSILIRSETTNKSDFLGYIFSKYINEEIKQNEFLKLSFSISNIFWNDIIEFSITEDLCRNDNSLLVDTFISNGLMTIYEIGARAGNSGGPINASINELGEILKKLYNDFIISTVK